MSDQGELFSRLACLLVENGVPRDAITFESETIDIVDPTTAAMHRRPGSLKLVVHLGRVLDRLTPEGLKS